MIRSVGLVSSSHLAANPRLVEEADVLVAAGYRVVASHYGPALRRLDETVLAVAPWQAEWVRLGAAGRGVRPTGDRRRASGS
jgi:hypothetical protein